MAQSPFYLDWTFWAVVVAFLALVLSQLPPIHIMFQRAKLDVEAYSRIHLTHKIGNPNAQLHLIVSNVGGREVKVKSIALHLKRGDEDHPAGVRHAGRQRGGFGGAGDHPQAVAQPRH